MKKNLKSYILLLPIIVLLLSFAVIFCIFDLSVKRYIQDISKKASSAEFSFFDYYYYGSEYKNPIQETGEFLLFSKSFIFDEYFKEVLPQGSKSFNEDVSLKISENLKFKKNDKENGEFKLQYTNQTYYVIYKSYEGVSDGVSIEKTDDIKKSKTYTVAVITDISYIQNFINKIGLSLIVLMLFSAILTVFVILRVGLKIDNSFSRLKDYILRVGNRIDGKKPENLNFLEFYEVADTIEHMSNLINEAEESRKYFFQNASHELKTPLMSIQGYAEGIQTGVLKDIKHAAGIIIKESSKMSNLVSEILMLSRMDSNYDEGKIEEIELKELIYACFWSIKNEAERRKILINIKFEKEDIFINANGALLEKAVSNILSNALRYAKTSILIVCSIENEYKKISIIDDGKGIDKDVLPHIFERFYKGEDGNTGIGLAITKEVVNKHKGFIKVNSDENGSEFIIYIP